MADNNFDVIVIGAGPGGYVTAIRAAQLGLKTAVVEREHVGGICLNWGCIPTKALLRSAEVYRNMHHAKDYGLSCEKPSFDLDAVIQRSRGVSKQLAGGVGHLLKKNKVTVINGEAKFDGPKKIVVEGKDKGTYTAKNYIIATGARARSLPGLEADGKVVWDYKKAMTPDKMPKSLVVVGSGAIGIEFASFYHTMGADVTVVEIMPQIMPVEDKEVAGLAQKMMTKDGMKILTEAKVANLKRNSDNVVVTVETKDGKKQELTVDRVISAVGVIGNTEGLGLETTKVKVDRNVIDTDEYSATAEPGIYAIGDVAGPPMLAHKAEHEGVICIEKIAGVKGVHPLDPRKIPGCTYCHPQVASVGLTEAKAKDAGYEVKVGKFPFIGNGKAVALGEAEGLVKTVFDAKTGELLGAHMVGAEVTELIQGFVVAMGLETTEEDLMHTVFPHPTLSEMMHESVLDAYGRAIHF
ncbi:MULTISPECIES: dihydrolipoyl dehydrogenase [Thalassospira]|uniref:dihydrolipoyl dehydrogenase n=2 Tax=Thalassospiraceae TaxID=2844866 RepID=UPI0002871B3E|nr:MULTISPECIES: dihydrolipoyl dehydrogenase [Thalassospira]BDW88838.1 dihydrolipoyl dehydrogenase [Thalassospira tepidiphila]EKF07596.1 dihydrolipoamide dehydrogenase [Thalassospira profundimaris WP0211]KZC97749.1 dihydrolipoamide dehydrogenase [Thalassospira sp. MCCC 1A02898]MBO6577433.1 dihydrolipoyl dehydrogenase [Thalassospira sp.]MBO6802582.1 dihydrolipoyl dehydrogenase [Thalassospira sp.]